MRTKNFIAVISVILILGAIIVGSCTAQKPTNYLKVKGKILNDHRASIVVKKYDEMNATWNTIKIKKNTTSYSLRLSTDKDYQILFTYEDNVKTINIQSGAPGTWITWLDIDFNINKNKSARMFQVRSKELYAIVGD